MRQSRSRVHPADPEGRVDGISGVEQHVPGRSGRPTTAIGDIPDPLARFYAFARERHAIYLRRVAGQKSPWTSDPILQRYRFTNVFRELDRTTQWFRKYVRDPLRGRPEVLPATVVFRWFNRISTGEAIFCQTVLPKVRGLPPPLLGEQYTAFDVFLHTRNPGNLNYALLALAPRGPWVTGAYTINTRSAGLGLTKLAGVLCLIDLWFKAHDWRIVAEQMIGGAPPHTLESFCAWVQSPCLGPFMAYEVACDLRWTALLEKAGDINTWANVGPGAQRGLNRLHDRPVNMSGRGEVPLQEMQWLLQKSREPFSWPRRVGWPRWELREVEHTLCEFDKMERVRLGQGRPRGRAPV